MAAEHAFKWVYGDDFSFTVTWNDASGDPQDLTGYTANMKVRNAATGAEMLHLYVGSGLSIPTPANGQIVCAATPTLMKAGSLVNAEAVHDYDLQARSSDGSILRTLIRGAFQVQKEYTDVDS